MIIDNVKVCAPFMTIWGKLSFTCKGTSLALTPFCVDLSNVKGHKVHTILLCGKLPIHSS